MPNRRTGFWFVIVSDVVPLSDTIFNVPSLKEIKPNDPQLNAAALILFEKLIKT